MAHWQSSSGPDVTAEEQSRHKAEALQWYQKAVDWTEKSSQDDEELKRFRAEAAELLNQKR